jgi:hypothetical protein
VFLDRLAIFVAIFVAILVAVLVTILLVAVLLVVVLLVVVFLVIVLFVVVTLLLISKSQLRALVVLVLRVPLSFSARLVAVAYELNNSSLLSTFPDERMSASL